MLFVVKFEYCINRTWILNELSLKEFSAYSESYIFISYMLVYGSCFYFVRSFVELFQIPEEIWAEKMSF